MTDQPNLLVLVKRYARARQLLAERSMEKHAKSLHEWLRIRQQEQRIELDARLRQQRADFLVASMPDTAAALRKLEEVHGRLCTLGWHNGIECPNDGSPFDVILYGSSSVHTGHYLGRWPTGHIVVTLRNSLKLTVAGYGTLWREVKADSAEVAA